MKDIEILWESNDENNIFNLLGVNAENHKKPKDTIRLDATIIYKKTTLRTIIDHLFSEINISISNEKVKYMLSFMEHVVLFSLSPSKTNINIYKDNNFRGIFKLFKKEFGEYYIPKSGISEIPNGNKIIDTLKRNKLIEEDEDRYYIIGHILKNIEFL